MPYLSKDIERLIKRKQQESLVRQQYSCGIFQEYDPFPGSTPPGGMHD